MIKKRTTRGRGLLIRVLMRKKRKNKNKSFTKSRSQCLSRELTRLLRRRKMMLRDCLTLWMTHYLLPAQSLCHPPSPYSPATQASANPNPSPQISHHPNHPNRPHFSHLPQNRSNLSIVMPTRVLSTTCRTDVNAYVRLLVITLFWARTHFTVSTARIFTIPGAWENRRTRGIVLFVIWECWCRIVWLLRRYLWGC